MRSRTEKYSSIILIINSTFLITYHNDILIIKEEGVHSMFLRPLLQMAKAAPQDQEVLGYYRECCENPNLIGNYSLLPCRYRTT